MNHQFPQPGTYTVNATFTSHVDSSQTSHSITVTVRPWQLQPPACQVSTARAIDLQDMPDEVVFDAGTALNLDVTSPTTGAKQLSITASRGGEHHVVARVGDGGPIIASRAWSRSGTSCRPAGSP